MISLISACSTFHLVLKGSAICHTDRIQTHFSSITSLSHASLRRGIPYSSNTSSQHSKKSLRFPHSIPVSTSYENDNEENEDEVPGELILHFCWDYLTSSEKTAVCEAAPVMKAYSSLRKRAFQMTKQDIVELQTPLDPSAQPSIDIKRIDFLSQLLLLCHFDFGILIKTLRGPYVADYLDFEHLDRVIEELQKVKEEEGEPVHDFERIKHQLHHGFPMKKEFRCKRKDVFLRNLYDNHRSIDPHHDMVEENIAKDIQKSFVLCFHRWIFRFISGLHLSPLGVLIKERYGVLKYRQLNDLSTLVLGEHDSGAPNSQLDKKNQSDVPPVYYGNTFTRLCSRIWNLRISYPDDVIYIYKDDIVSAFRRSKYNPAIAPAYAYVFKGFLCIPVGALFGPRDSPGWFCMLSELRAFASANLTELEEAKHPLSDSIDFDDPSEHPLAKALADSINKGIDIAKRGKHLAFVDDTMMTEIKKHIRISAAASIISAEIIFGKEPDVDSPVSKEKFMKLFSHYCDCLGIDVDAQRLLVIYPLDKRTALCSQVKDIVRSIDSQTMILVSMVATVLGKLRHAAQVLPAGNFLCFHMQESLNAHITRNGIVKGWSKYSKIHLSQASKWALRLLLQCLQDENNPVWTRPIGLLVPRDPHATPYSDASTSGLGGYCLILDFQWRIAIEDLLKGTGFKPQSKKEGDHAHINILEFIGIIINIYFSIVKVKAKKKYDKCFEFDQGFILHCFADNTSALSWMHHASRSHCTVTRNLAQFLLCLLFYANKHIPLAVQGFHVKGENNERADALSRPLVYPKYEDVFEMYSDLKNIQIYQTPVKLIVQLRRCLSLRLIEAPTEATMSALLKVDVKSLRHSAKS